MNAQLVTKILLGCDEAVVKYSKVCVEEEMQFRAAAHMGSISLWISFAASIFFCPQKTHNATLFYRGTFIQGCRHLVTAITSVQSCASRSLCVTIKLDSAAI
jgi:hypothetical protein